MRITVKENRETILKAVCNCCGRELSVDNGLVLEEYVHIDKKWGYFSEKDGEEIVFDLCEDCTDSLVKTFKVPPLRRETREWI